MENCRIDAAAYMCNEIETVCLSKFLAFQFLSNYLMTMTYPVPKLVVSDSANPTWQQR
jgi:hypothetical protein